MKYFVNKKSQVGINANAKTVKHVNVLDIIITPNFKRSNGQPYVNITR